MPKEKKERFILTFKLQTEPWQEDIIDKRIEAGRKIYNQLVHESLKRWNELKKSKKYRALLKSLTHDKEKDLPIWQEINRMRKNVGLSEYGLSSMVTLIRQYWKKHINVHIAQKISLQVWHSFEDYFFGKGKHIRYKKYGQFNSLEGKNNTNGIVFKPKQLSCVWGGLKIPVVVDEKNPYEMEALEMVVAYCRVLRKIIRGKRKYYFQVVFKGQKPAKRRKSDGSFVHVLGQGDVGIDIGVSTIAFTSKDEVHIYELADKAQGLERERLLLQRKMDRSRRATNPDNFNENGTAKKGHCRWVRSNRYFKTLLKLKEISRKQAAIRKHQHELLANHILALGDKFYVETMNFKGLQKRAKKTEINKKTGKYKCKKRYGKSLANRAPAMMISILARKLGYFHIPLVEINTWKAKASQFNHLTKECHKKTRSQRWAIVNGRKVQRDMYSSFLIMNINEDLKTYNMGKCNSRYEKFLVLHDEEVARLRGKKNLRCVGI